MCQKAPPSLSRHRMFAETSRSRPLALKKEWLTAGYRGNLRRNSCLKFESILEKNHFAVDSRFSGGVTHKKTFLSCELSLPVDGSKGDMIHFLGERKPYGCGRLMLLSQLQILSEQDTNPFECTSSDSEEAYPTLYLLDSDHKEDSYMKLSELCSLYFTLSIAVVLTCKLWKRERAMEHVLFLNLKWLPSILLFARNKLDFK